MLVADQNFSAPISESAEYRQIRMLAVSEPLYRRLGSWSWSNEIQQTGVTDIAAGYGGFWQRTSESKKKKLKDVNKRGGGLTKTMQRTLRRHDVV